MGMANTCHALVASPGGFGTCDELFELLTLIQTGKHPDIPIVLFSKKFWSKVINWDALVEFGTISPDDAKKFIITDSIDEAYDHITKYLDRMEHDVMKRTVKQMRKPRSKGGDYTQA